ncbi:MAG: hypothetical protein ACPGSI_16560 [Pikeienuella sp.]
MKFPATIYTVWIDTPDLGLVSVPDTETTFDDVLDQAVSTPWIDVPFRMFRMDFDVETGALESTSEVTEEAQKIITDRLIARGFLEAAE